MSRLRSTDSILQLPVADLIPHAKPMILVDKLTNWGENFAECRVNHSHDNGFWDEQGRIPAYVGIEYMAQTISVYSGILSTLAGNPVKVAYLLGTRLFDTNQCYMHRHQPVTVRVEELYRNEDNIAVFDCQLSGEDVMMKAQLKGVQPD